MCVRNEISDAKLLHQKETCFLLDLKNRYAVTSVVVVVVAHQSTDYNSNNLHNINFQVAIIITFKFFLLYTE